LASLTEEPHPHGKIDERNDFAAMELMNSAKERCSLEEITKYAESEAGTGVEEDRVLKRGERNA